MARPVPSDQIRDLFRIATLSRDPVLIERLIASGANPNDRHDDEHILRSFVWAITSWSSELTAEEKKSGLAALAVVLRAGSRMDFNEEEIASLGSSLRKTAPCTADAILELFKQHGLLDDAALRKITRAKSMKRLLGRPAMRHFASPA